MANEEPDLGGKCRSLGVTGEGVLKDPVPGDKHGEIIVIPRDARALPLAQFALSARLTHVLAACGFQRLGELHGLSYFKISAYPNCGRTTIEEIRKLVRSVQLGDVPDPIAVPGLPAPPPSDDLYISIPEFAHELSPLDLPISVRLAGVLESKGIKRLGDLHGTRAGNFKVCVNCGKRTFNELTAIVGRIAKGDFRPVKDDFRPANTAELLELLDRAIKQLPNQWRQMLLLRFGGDGSKGQTLDLIAQKYRLTRERVRQIEQKALSLIVQSASLKINAFLRGMAKRCGEKVFPLRPAVLEKWIAASSAKAGYLPSFYLRLFRELNFEIPIWIPGQELPVASSRDVEISHAAERVLREMLRSDRQVLPLNKVYQHVMEQMRGKKPTVLEFLESLKKSRAIEVDFSSFEPGRARLRRIPIREAVKVILDASPCPLTLEHILTKAREKFGEGVTRWNERTMGNYILIGQGFFLLGPGCYGRRQHFRLPDCLWPEVRRDVGLLLATENKPLSTADMVDARKFAWASQTNKYELAYVLRDDKSFVDLGRFLFGLSEWGIEERSYIKDLIPKILAEAGHPMPPVQIWESLRRLRSMSPNGLQNALRNSPLVCKCGIGLYGLKSWDNSPENHLVMNGKLVEQAVRRSESPLRDQVDANQNPETEIRSLNRRSQRKRRTAAPFLLR